MPSTRPATARSGADKGPGTASPSWRESRTRADQDRVARRPRRQEARYIEAAVRGIIVTSIYLPNGQSASPVRNSTTSSNGSAAEVARREFIKQDIPVVLAGDYNVAPTERDIYPTDHWTRMR